MKGDKNSSRAGCSDLSKQQFLESRQYTGQQKDVLNAYCRMKKSTRMSKLIISWMNSTEG